MVLLILLSRPLPPLHTLCQKILDLSVHRTKLILCPLCDLIVKLLGKSQWNLLFTLLFLSFPFPKSVPPSNYFSQILRPTILIQASTVHDRLCIFISAKDDQKIAHHCCFSLFIQFYNIILVQFVKCHLYHADSTFHDFCLASMIAAACCLCSIADAISGA